MTDIEFQDGPRDASSGYKVDVSRGGHDGRVSSEWFARPDDERYLSLSALQAAVRTRADRSRTRIVESAAIRVEASRDEPSSRSSQMRSVRPGRNASRNGRTRWHSA